VENDLNGNKITLNTIIMKKQNLLKIISSLLGIIILFSSCKKNGGIDPEDRSVAFEDLNELKQQEAVVEGLQKYLGKSYRLSYRSTFTSNDVYNEKPDECQKDIIITFPSSVNNGEFIKQTVKDNSCGYSWTDALKLNTELYGFSNYKIGFSFFTVLDNNTKGVLKFSKKMIFVINEKNEQNTSDKYLEMIEPAEADFNAVNGNFGKVKASIYRKYIFELIN